MYAVLTEDLYETRYGDGEFHYLCAVVLDRDEGEQRVSHMQGEWTRGHLRTVAIRLDRETIVFPGFEREPCDEHGPEQVLKALEAALARLEN